jgi:hypothetical protein
VAAVPEPSHVAGGPEPASADSGDRRMPYPPGTIVAGMGRSGTSLVTNALGCAGWRLGERLIVANRRNQRGFFEDAAVNELHKRMLAEHGLVWNDVDGLRLLRGRRLAIPPGCRTAAERIVADYRSGPAWAWKNPKATPFLHAWAELVPEARFLLCVRHPAGVAASLRRRRDSMLGGNRSKLRYYARAFSLWRSYNLVVLDFVREQPDRAAIVLIPDDVPVLEAVMSGVFESELMHEPSAKVRLASRAAVASLALYSELRELHDPAKLEAFLAPPQATTAPARSPRQSSSLAR